jgi:predicted Zn-dependent protease
MAARLAAPLLPFTWEIALAERMPRPDIGKETAGSPTQRTLAALTARVAAASDLPADMVISVHYVETDTVNAFATLGGHIVVFEGLWKLLDSENAAAMLIAHEIAHVKNRDPIRSVSGALFASLVAGALFGDIGIADMGNVLTALHFSREQETRADSDAARAVVKLYGHLNGAADLFDRMRAAAIDAKQPPAFLASHPYLADRIVNLRRQAGRNGWNLRGEKKPLP